MIKSIDESIHVKSNFSWNGHQRMPRVSWCNSMTLWVWCVLIAAACWYTHIPTSCWFSCSKVLRALRTSPRTNELLEQQNREVEIAVMQLDLGNALWQDVADSRLRLNFWMCSLASDCSSFCHPSGRPAWPWRPVWSIISFFWSIVTFASSNSEKRIGAARDATTILFLSRMEFAALPTFLFSMNGAGSPTTSN